jgi:hypothetical protein
VRQKSHWRWRQKQILVLAVIVALVPLPLLAGDGGPSTPATQTLRASAARIVVREAQKQASEEMDAARSGAPDAQSTAFLKDRAGAVAPAAATRAEQSGAPNTESAAFFKSGVGVAVVAVLAVGAGYALYSAQHDRVHSAGKK